MHLYILYINREMSVLVQPATIMCSAPLSRAEVVLLM